MNFCFAFNPSALVRPGSFHSLGLTHTALSFRRSDLRLRLSGSPQAALLGTPLTHICLIRKTPDNQNVYSLHNLTPSICSIRFKSPLSVLRTGADLKVIRTAANMLRIAAFVLRASLNRLMSVQGADNIPAGKEMARNYPVPEGAAAHYLELRYG